MDTEVKENSFLGRGWSFPPAFIKEKREVLLTADEEDIKSSLEILLSTRPGERLMQPLFGCSLDRLQFEPLTTSLKTYMRTLVEQAIIRFEPRVDLEEVRLDDSEELEGKVLIHVQYRIRATNSRFNLVFPYYLDQKPVE